MAVRSPRSPSGICFPLKTGATSLGSLVSPGPSTSLARNAKAFKTDAWGENAERLGILESLKNNCEEARAQRN